jgi:hypothetical protein
MMQQLLLIQMLRKVHLEHQFKKKIKQSVTYLKTFVLLTYFLFLSQLLIKEDLQIRNFTPVYHSKL